MKLSLVLFYEKKGDGMGIYQSVVKLRFEQLSGCKDQKVSEEELFFNLRIFIWVEGMNKGSLNGYFSCCSKVIRKRCNFKK